jgi:hypothetical protein
MPELTPAEQMLYSTVKLVAKRAGKICSTGTGFFVNFARRGQSMVPTIVTNKHVIANSDSVTALCHLAENGKPSGKFVECTMPTSGGMVFPHPSDTVDLCAIPIGPIVHQALANNSPLFLVYLGLDLIPTDDDWEYFDAIEEVTMIGCPNGISDEANNLPIVRRGITATSLGKPYNGNPEFMVDMACFPGSSGSPIFLHNRTGYLDRRKNTYMMGGSRIRLVGVLYAGPHFTNRGQIILARPSEFSVATMMHLGIAIRSAELHAIDAEIKRIVPDMPALLSNKVA